MYLQKLPFLLHLGHSLLMCLNKILHPLFLMVCGLGMPARASEGHGGFFLGLHPAQHPLVPVLPCCGLSLEDGSLRHLLPSYFPEEAVYFFPLINF